MFNPPLQAQRFDCYAISRSTADGWRAAHDHVADRLRHAFVVAVGPVNLPVGQEALVEHDDAIVIPSDGSDGHGSAFYLDGALFRWRAFYL